MGGVVLCAIAFCSAGCAGSGRAKSADPIGEAIEQPFRDLNLIQQEAAQAVAKAAQAPYRAPADCSAAAAELARLNDALGPDLDAEASSGLEGMAGEIVKEVTAIPFSGVVRRISGAAKAARERRRMILAAVARRGFLKGWGVVQGCPLPMVGAEHR